MGKRGTGKEVLAREIHKKLNKGLCEELELSKKQVYRVFKKYNIKFDKNVNK